MLKQFRGCDKIFIYLREQLHLTHDSLQLLFMCANLLWVLRRRLQDNHCGGLANKGTDTALIQLIINLLEDLEDVNGAADHEVSDTPLDFMSWDTAKAFDSVGNHVQYAAWRRMGVSVNIASWLMALDLGGSFVILMPHSQRTLDAIRMTGPQDTSHHEKIRGLG
jgi:hypothetical protein